MVKKQSFTQKILATVLLLLFLFAITPHIFVHDVLEKHHDTIDHFHTDTEVSSHHIHCQFLNVVIAPFSVVHRITLVDMPSMKTRYVECFISFQPVKEFVHFSLRGPPLS